MFTDEPRRSVWEQIRQQDLRAFASLLTPAVLCQAATVAGVAMGRGPLELATLAWLAVSSALHTTRNFADVLVMTLAGAEAKERNTTRVRKTPTR